MTDEVLCKRLRGWAKDIQEGSTAIYAMDLDLKNAASSIEALTEQLEAARADADEAEAYAWQLEQRLAKAVEGLREIASEASVTVHTHNKGGINYTRMYEDWRKLAVKRIDKARATLAEIEGEKG